jgi:HEAT repeat protein
MTTRLALWGLAAVVALAALAVVVPASPVYLPKWFSLGPRSGGKSIGHWVDALDSPDAEVRTEAIFRLGHIGKDAGEAVPALATILLEDADRNIRREAALALSKMGTAAVPAVPALAEALSDQELTVRMNAAKALFGLKAEARPAVPALIEALKDKGNEKYVARFHITIREMVVIALGGASAGTAEGVPALTAALEAADTDGMRKAASRALGDVGPEARPALPLLRALLKDQNAEVRETAKEALQKIEEQPSPDR